MGKEIREVTSPELKAASRRFNSALDRPSGNIKMNKFALYLIRYWIGKLYKSVPKEDGIKFSKVRLGNTNAVLAQPQEGSTSKDIIVYIDFSNIFNRKGNYKKYVDRINKAKDMFRPEGISLDLGNGNYRYIAFERSASMSRQSRLSFIREDF